jgi:hypothetical protein
MRYYLRDLNQFVRFLLSSDKLLTEVLYFFLSSRSLLIFTVIVNGLKFRILKKTIKTPLLMSESFRLTCCCHGVAPESKLSRTPRQHHSFHGNADIIRGKNIKNMSCGKTGVKSLIVQVLKCSSNYQSNQTSSARFTLEDQFFMFSPQRVSVLRRSCYQLGQECENLFSGTQARAENVGRSPLTLTEVFFYVLFFYK